MITLGCTDFQTQLRFNEYYGKLLFEKKYDIKKKGRYKWHKKLFLVAVGI